MNDNQHRPVIVQSDRTVLLEVQSPGYEESRNFLRRFLDLEKSPGYVQTYRLTHLTIWNALSSGMKVDEILDGLAKYSKYDVPENIKIDIRDMAGCYGKVRLLPYEPDSSRLLLKSQDEAVMVEAANHKSVAPLLKKKISDREYLVSAIDRGEIKQALIKIRYPVLDLAGHQEGDALNIRLRSETLQKRQFCLRDYQLGAAEAFYDSGRASGGSGIIVLPCGAGKTVVGMAVMERVKSETLIITPNMSSVKQWQRELLDKTSISPDSIGEYSGETKNIKPITVTTYQILTHRKNSNSEFTHFSLFAARKWGLVIYDEVHLLPAPVFRATVGIQAKRRLGLTATLVREDGLEDDVFGLIGPKRYEVPWKDLEESGHLAKAECHEIRIPMGGGLRMKYAYADERNKFRLASENPEKERSIVSLLEAHREDSVLIIGQYISQLEALSERLNIVLITGKTPNKEREKLYRQFRAGEIKKLMVSKVGNFAIDLPDANVLIQISGTFGSRQEEAQRLGRILRPKRDARGAYFYSLITKDSKEQFFAGNRQLFLTEQGYQYQITIN